MKYSRNLGVFTKKIGDVWYILEDDKKSVLELNPVASSIWELLAKPCSTASLVKSIRKEYSADQKLAETDVANLVRDYVKLGFLIEVD